MPSLPSRELVITYAGYAVNPDGPVRLERSGDSFVVDFAFIVNGTTEAGFQAAIVAAEAAYRQPFRDLTVVQGSQTLLDASMSSNLGLEVQPSISKDEHVVDTGRSRRYLATVRGRLPANNIAVSGDMGLREFSYDVLFTPARRKHVTFQGVYTAVSSTFARDQYNGLIATKISGILSALGGTYELAEEPTTQSSYHDQELAFTRVYDEIIYPQGGSANDAAIVRQNFAVTTRRLSVWGAPSGVGILGDSGGTTSEGGRGGSGPAGDPQALTIIEATYDAWIDKTVTQDLPGKWKAIRAWAIGVLQSTVTGSFALISEEPQYQFDDNRISVTLSGLATDDGSGVLARDYSMTSAKTPGFVLVPVWNGDPLARHKYQGPGSFRVSQTLTYEALPNAGAGASASVGAMFGGVAGANVARSASATGAGTYQQTPRPGDGSGGKDAIVISDITTDPEPSSVGLDGKRIQTNRYTRTLVLEFVNVVTTASSNSNSPITLTS